MSHYQVHTNAQSHFIQAGNRILGAYGTSFWRRTVFCPRILILDICHLLL